MSLIAFVAVVTFCASRARLVLASAKLVSRAAVLTLELVDCVGLVLWATDCCLGAVLALSAVVELLLVE